MEKSLRDSVAFVMASCNRFDLVVPTLQSFLDYNTYPIEQYILIEDTEKIRVLEKVIKEFPEVYKKALQTILKLHLLKMLVTKKKLAILIMN